MLFLLAHCHTVMAHWATYRRSYNRTEPPLIVLVTPVLFLQWRVKLCCEDRLWATVRRKSCSVFVTAYRAHLHTRMFTLFWNKHVAISHRKSHTFTEASIYIVFTKKCIISRQNHQFPCLSQQLKTVVSVEPALSVQREGELVSSVQLADFWDQNIITWGRL